MAGGTAKVESIETLKALRRSLFKFAEAANVALADAESELNRTLMWVQNEQIQHWTSQIRKRQELVSRCEEAVRMKKLFVDAAGRRSSAIDEQKALDKAKRMLEEAIQKLANCKSWSRKLEKEIQMYKGGVQRFTTTVEGVLPVAAARLESAVLKLEEYLALGVPMEQISAAGALSEPSPTVIEPSASMARPEADVAAPPVEQKPTSPETSVSQPPDSTKQNA